MEDLPAAWNIDEGLLAARRVDGSGLKLTRWHGKFMEVDGRSSGISKSSWKFKEGLPAAWKVYRILRKVSWRHGKLREFDRRSPSSTEC